MQDHTIRKSIWSGVVTKESGRAVGAINIGVGDGQIPIQVQASEDELESLVAMLEETIAEVRRINGS